MQTRLTKLPRLSVTERLPYIYWERFDLHATIFFFFETMRNRSLQMCLVLLTFAPEGDWRHTMQVTVHLLSFSLERKFINIKFVHHLSYCLFTKTIDHHVSAYFSTRIHTHTHHLLKNRLHCLHFPVKELIQIFVHELHSTRYYQTALY